MSWYNYVRVYTVPALKNILFFLLIVAIPRQNIVHDIFSFVACGVTTPRLIEECPDLLSLRPATQEIQVASIKTIPMYRYDKYMKYFNS